MQDVLVSIIIPTYKRPALLEKTIESALNQTYKNIEVIVVDDNGLGSHAQIKTEEMINQFEVDSRFHYITHKVNKNGAAARNTGFKYSSGDFIMFLDDDDFILPDKISEHVELHQQSPKEFGASYSYYKRYKNGKLFDVSTDNLEGNLTYEILTNSVHIQAGSNLFIRRDVVEKVGGYDESFNRRQDIEFALKISQETSFKCVESIQLVINLDDRSNTLSLEENEQNIAHYFIVFESYIESYNHKAKEKIYKSQYLQLWRTAILKKNFKFSKKVKKTYQLGFQLRLRYLLYSVFRVITKSNFGFKI